MSLQWGYDSLIVTSALLTMTQFKNCGTQNFWNLHMGVPCIEVVAHKISNLYKCTTLSLTRIQYLCDVKNLTWSIFNHLMTLFKLSRLSKLMSPVLQSCVVLWYDAYVSEVHTTSIFRMKWLGQGKKGTDIGPD